MTLFMIIGPLGFIALALAMVYVGLVARQRECSRAEESYRKQLAMRADAIDVLLEAIPAKMASLKSARLAVATASEHAVQAASPDRFSFEEGHLVTAIETLVAHASNHPTVRDDPAYSSARRKLLLADARLTTARRSRRRAYAEYECACDAFPGVLFAGMLGFKPMSYDQPSLSAGLQMTELHQ